MPTVLDELVVALRLDASGFTDGQRKALSEFERLKSNVQTSAQTIGTSAASSLHEYLGSIHHELQDVNVALLAMSSQSRRAGESVRAGANAGSDGLKNLAAAAAGAVASIATVHETISGLSSVAGRTAQDVRAAWQTGLDPRFLRAFEQYAFQAGNVDYGTTQSTLAGFEQKRQSYKAQGQYPEEFTQLAFFLGMSPDEAATMPMEQLLTRISERIAKQGTSGPLAQLIASQTAFGSLGYVLGLGPNALHQGVQRNLDTGIDSGQIENLTKLNRAINDFEVGWQNASSAIVASHPEWTKAIENLTNIENWLTKNKEAADTLGTVFEFVAASIIVPSIWKIAQAIIGANASILATPLGRALFAVWAVGEAAKEIGEHPEEFPLLQHPPAGGPKPGESMGDYMRRGAKEREQQLQSGSDNRTFLEKVLPTWLGGKSAPSGGGTNNAAPASSSFNPSNDGTDIEMASAAIRAAGGNDNAVAGALGAMFAESKMNPGLVAPGGDTSWAQWVGKRKQRLYALGWRPGDPQAQRQASAKLLNEELTGPFHNTLMRMNAVPPTQAGKIFGFDFEQGGGNPSLFGTGHETQASLDAFHSRYADKFYGMVHDARAGGGSNTTNNTNSNVSTGPITVNVPSGNPLSVGGAVHQAVRDALVTHVNTGVSG